MNKITQSAAIKLAEKLTNINQSDLKISPLKNEQGFYIYQPTRGGISLIVANDKSVLFANSATNFDDHLKAFNSGTRSDIKPIG